MTSEALLNNASYELRIVNTSSRVAIDILNAPHRQFALLDELLTIYLVANVPLSMDVPEKRRLETLNAFCRTVDVSVYATISESSSDTASISKAILFPASSSIAINGPPVLSPLSLPVVPLAGTASKPTTPIEQPQTFTPQLIADHQQRGRSLSTVLRSPVKSIFAAKPQQSTGQFTFPLSMFSTTDDDPVRITTSNVASVQAPVYQYSYNYNANARGQEPILHPNGHCLFPLTIPVGYMAASGQSGGNNGSLTIVATIVQKPSSMITIRAYQSDSEWMEDSAIDSINILSKLADHPHFQKAAPVLRVSSKTPLKSAPTIPLLRRTVQASFSVLTPLQIYVKPISIRLDNRSYFLDVLITNTGAQQLSFSIQSVSIQSSDVIVGPCSYVNQFPLTLKPNDELRLVFTVAKTEGRSIAAIQPELKTKKKQLEAQERATITYPIGPEVKREILSVCIETRIEEIAGLAEQSLLSRWECVIHDVGNSVVNIGDSRTSLSNHLSSDTNAIQSQASLARVENSTLRAPSLPAMVAQLSKKWLTPNQNPLRKDGSNSPGAMTATNRFSFDTGRRQNSNHNSTFTNVQQPDDYDTVNSLTEYTSLPLTRMYKGESQTSVLAASNGGVLFNFKVLGTAPVRNLFGIAVYVINRTLDTKSYRIRIPPSDIKQENKSSSNKPTLTFFQALKQQRPSVPSEDALVCLDNNIKLQNIRPGGVAFAHLHFISVAPGLNHVARIEIDDCDTGEIIVIRDTLSLWVDGESCSLPIEHATPTMPLRLFPRSSSHNAIDDHDVSMKLPGYNASSATLNMPRETLHKFEFGLHKKLSMASSRTLSELTPIPEVAAKQATSVSYITESSSSCSIVRDSPTTSFSASAGTVTNAVSKLSISKRPTSKLSFFKFLKNEKLDKKLKQQEITSKEKAAQISSVAATKVVTRVLTTSEKESRALVEREKRLAEVLSVIEGRKVLPEGLNRYRFVNFIGDGTYGFVLTAFNEKNEEVAVKFIFKEKVPQASWTRSESLGLVPAEVHYLSLLNHPSIIHFVACFEDSEYVILVTELHGTSWDSLNLKLNETNNPGLKSEPRHVRCGSEGKGDLNTLASLSATQRETLKPRVSCDLFECIDAHDKFPEYIVRRIFSQIVSAVKYLHDNNIVHRDLKDENIAIDEHYNVKLLDFGSAAFVPKTARDYFDKFLGTLDFASPEIVEGYRYRGPEAEVWALGVLLYIIVFRQIPFKSNEDIKCGQVLLPRAQDVNDPDYPDVQSLFELIRLMLNPNSVERVTLDKVVDHPWLQGSCRLD